MWSFWIEVVNHTHKTHPSIRVIAGVGMGRRNLKKLLKATLL